MNDESKLNAGNINTVYSNTIHMNDIRRCRGGSFSKPEAMEEIPGYNHYYMILQHNYNVNKLKKIAKHYKQKVSGNKKELTYRIYDYLRHSYHAVKIQKYFRGNLQRKQNRLRGPAFLKRDLCTNPSDFLTMEPLNEIHPFQFYSFRDEEGFVYGFDISSMNHLIETHIAKEGNHDVLNPYNRLPLNVSEILRSIKTLSKLCKCMKLAIPEAEELMTPHQKMESDITDLFQKLDSLGNYTNRSWFTDLSIYRIVIFMRELKDIWFYRAQIPKEVLRSICPPAGNPFSFLENNSMRYNISTLSEARSVSMKIMRNILYSSPDPEMQSLGAIYILSALTLVSTEAAIAMPWLYDSVVHFP